MVDVHVGLYTLRGRVAEAGKILCGQYIDTVDIKGGIDDLPAGYPLLPASQPSIEGDMNLVGGLIEPQVDHIIRAEPDPGFGGAWPGVADLFLPVTKGQCLLFVLIGDLCPIRCNGATQCSRIYRSGSPVTEIQAWH